MKYGIHFKASVNGRARKADVTVTDEDGNLCTTDQVQAFDGEERRKLVKRLAKRLKIDPERLEDPVELAWAAEADRLDKANKAEEEARAKQEEERARQETAAGPTGSTGTTGNRDTPYSVARGCISRKRFTRDGDEVLEPLCNFAATITEEVAIDDGSGELQRAFTLAGVLPDGTPLPPATVRAADFASMNWPVASWGLRAIVNAGLGAKDHLRVAIQELSQGSAVRRTIYRHTGWRKVGDGWVYLHAGGAIGSEGNIDSVAVDLSGHLAHYHLPKPPTGELLIQAVREPGSAGAGPTRVTTPLLGAAYRAPLGRTDCSMFVVGPTGAGKSELSALNMQHFGAEMDRLNLPGNWSSTANALEALAFLAKDALLVLDDFKPGGSKGEIDQWHSKADRVLRAQGNASARQRCRSDGTPAVERPPRGIIV